ncbi:MAG: hypothetical protein LBQ15_01105 [Clostridium sp.]|jgi:hypothetical protein|nr:hypothetical protein [Clostridium sp.]
MKMKMKMKKRFFFLASAVLASGAVVQAGTKHWEEGRQIAASQVEISRDGFLVSKHTENCVIITRASGEVEVYPLEEIWEEPNMIDSAEVTMVKDSLTRNDPSDYIDYGFSDIGAAAVGAVSRNINWDVPGNVISYSSTQLALNKGDSIDFLIATTTGYSCYIGLMDRTNWSFHSSGYFGGTSGWSISDGFTVLVDFSSVSFAIHNLRAETTNFSGSYTAPR